jgi:UDP-3-O-[3-hydroxymyristoyl] glucosamine N-acyltransferase
MTAQRSVRELAEHVGGELRGDANRMISGVSGLADARAEQLSFYGSARYRRDLAGTQAGAILVGSDFPDRPGATLIQVKNPSLAFARISALFHPRKSFTPGISPRASVHPEARVDATATVMAGATVEKGAQVGARSVLFPGVYVGEQARVGADCVLHPNACIYDRCLLGDRVVLHASSVVGADGFGYAFDAERFEHVKVPQAGIARIEDDVEIGAGSCVDRATLGETVVGKGSKLDNLVQVAHNVVVGPLGILCAQVGVAGSTQLGAGVVLGGQAGIINHLKVGDRVQVGAKSAVFQDVPDGQVVSGYPAMEQKAWLKNSVAQGQLVALMKEVRQLRKKIEELEQGRKP